jgi:2-polyprenyl-3-methyl-5-hydroxy-6-metoxy-1,4-benzoquinol methylase
LKVPIVPLEDPTLPFATERRLLFDPSPDEFEVRAQETGWSRTLETLKNLALKHLRGVNGIKLLDVACGPGLLARQFSKAGAQVTGLDASLEMLTHAAKHLSHGDRLIQYDLAWPLDKCMLPRNYDLVLCSGALQLCPDYRERLEDFVKMLAPRGVLAVAYPTQVSARFEPSCRRINTRELLSMLTASGLTVREQESVQGYSCKGTIAVPYTLVIASAPSGEVQTSGNYDSFGELKTPTHLSRLE